MAFNSHVADNNIIKDSVWYTGTDALTRGEPLCYANDEGSEVARPSQSNNLRFAGTVANDYSAGSSSGRLVEICLPGSKGAPVLLGETVAVGDYVTFVLGTTTKDFLLGGFLGCGTAKVTDAGDDGDVVQADLLVGDESGGIEVLDPTAGAITCSVGGVTFFNAATLASAGAVTVADPIADGLLKKFEALGTMTTSDIEIDLETASLQPDFATALQAINAIDADGDSVTLQARGGAWYVVGKSGGATLSAT